jgi:hypothetical protein
MFLNQEDFKKNLLSIKLSFKRLSGSPGHAKSKKLSAIAPEHEDYIPYAPHFIEAISKNLLSIIKYNLQILRNHLKYPGCQ